LAYNHALSVVGPELGKKVADGEYDHVHFIAHSAGAAAISMASEYVKADSPDTVVHTTFLDPYMPLGARGFYGHAADWADNYFTLGGIFTGGALPNAYNVDVTGLDPNGGPGSTHGWPIQWYRQTVEGTAPAGSGDFGFPLSLEGGSWNPSAYPVGNDPRQLVIRDDPAVDIANQGYVTSDTGTVNLTGSGFSMLTGSPVWMMTLVETEDIVNFLTFQADFTSDSGAEGLLAIYWNNELVGLIDERYVLDGMQEYTMLLPDNFDPGVYGLSFRLDPYTDTASSVDIDSICTGYVVPEPATLSLLAAGALVVFKRKRR